MVGDFPSEQDKGNQAVAEFNDRLTRLEGRREEDLVYVDEYDLRELSSRAWAVSDSERAKARPTLKKMLLLSPSWRNPAKYIQDNLTDLTYSPEERSSFDEETKKARQREKEIEAEIDSGVSPWLAHTNHNERGIQNPYVVGFYQDDEGKIMTVY